MLIDIMIAGYAIFGFVKGFSAGLVRTLFELLAWIIGLLIALKLTSVISVLVASKLNWNPSYLPILVFVAIIVIAHLAITGVGKVVEKLIKVVQLGWLNRVLGGIVYVVVNLTIFSVFLWLLVKSGMISADTIHQSKLFFIVSPIAPAVMSFVSNLLHNTNLLAELENYFHH
jgi:membrane protein required for colicin V production